MSSLAAEKEKHRSELIQLRWTIGRPYLWDCWSDCSVRWLERCVCKLSTTRYLQIMVPLSIRRDMADVVRSSLATGR